MGKKGTLGAGLPPKTERQVINEYTSEFASSIEEQNTVTAEISSNVRAASERTHDVSQMLTDLANDASETETSAQKIQGVSSAIDQALHVRRRVVLIATPGSGAAAVAAKAVTTSIPIVFATGADPVALELVASLNHPGGSVTGIVSQNVELAAKRLEMLREMVPQATHYFAVVNPTSPLTEPFMDDLKAGAKKLGIQVGVLTAGGEAEIDAAFAGPPEQSGTALVFSSDGFLYGRRGQIVALAARYALPAIYDGRDYVDAGGLASYGADF